VYDICPLKAWSQDGANAGNTRSSPYNIPTQYNERWHVQVAGGSAVTGMCVGQGGLLYFAVTPVSARGPCSLWIVDQYGTKQATISIPASSTGGIGSPAQAANGEIFVPNDDGIIYRVDPKTSTVTKIFTEPTHSNDQITYLKIDDGGFLYAMTANGKFYAMDQTGRLRWSSFAIPANCLNLSSPAIDFSLKRIYIPYKNTATNTAFLAMLDATNGQTLATKTLGTVPAGSWTPGTPAVSQNNTVYITCNTVLYALDPRNNLAEKWHNADTTWTPDLAAAMAQDGTIYAIHHNYSAGGAEFLAALDPSDGHIRWRTDSFLPLNQYSHISSVCAAAGNTLTFTVATRAGASSPTTYTVCTVEDHGSTAALDWSHDFGTGGGSLVVGPLDTIYVLPGATSSRTITAIGTGIGAGRTNNAAPNPPADTGIPDGAVVSGTTATISWSCSDPDGNALTYTLYLVDGNDIQVVASGIAVTSYTVTGLDPGTVYRWQVIASDGQALTPSQSWSFSTSPGPLRIGQDVWTTAGLTLMLGSDGKVHLFLTGTTKDVVPPWTPGSVSNIEINSPSDTTASLTIDSTYGNPIPAGGITYTGGGGLIKSGPGNVALSRTDSYTGGSTVSMGSLAVTSSNALPNGKSLTVGVGGTFIFDPSMTGSAVTVASATESSSPATGESPNLQASVSITPPSLKAPGNASIEHVVAPEACGTGRTDTPPLCTHSTMKLGVAASVDAALVQHFRRWASEAVGARAYPVDVTLLAASSAFVQLDNQEKKTGRSIQALDAILVQYGLGLS